MAEVMHLHCGGSLWKARLFVLPIVHHGLEEQGPHTIDNAQYDEVATVLRRHRRCVGQISLLRGIYTAAAVLHLEKNARNVLPWMLSEVEGYEETPRLPGESVLEVSASAQVSSKITFIAGIIYTPEGAEPRLPKSDEWATSSLPMETSFVLGASKTTTEVLSLPLHVCAPSSACDGIIEAVKRIIDDAVFNEGASETHAEVQDDGVICIYVRDEKMCIDPRVLGDAAIDTLKEHLNRRMAWAEQSETDGRS